MIDWPSFLLGTVFASVLIGSCLMFLICKIVGDSETINDASDDDADAQRLVDHCGFVATHPPRDKL